MTRIWRCAASLERLAALCGDRLLRIGLSADPHDGILVEIHDTGIGIAPEDIERVMRPFEQVDATFTRAHDGTGLGLPLAKKLVELRAEDR